MISNGRSNKQPEFSPTFAQRAFQLNQTFDSIPIWLKNIKYRSKAFTDDKVGKKSSQEEISM